MTAEESESLQAMSAANSVRITNWVNRLPTYFVSWCSATTVKYHVLGSPITGSFSWSITGFILE
jgi:hypothetical protein